MSFHVSQEQMESNFRTALANRVVRGGEICSMLILEFEECDAEAAEVTLRHTVTQVAANTAGNLHGGIITWLMDATMGMLSRAYTGFERTVTMDIHVNFLRPIRMGDIMILKGRITHVGRNTVNLCCEALVKDKLCATADAIFYKVG